MVPSVESLPKMDSKESSSFKLLANCLLWRTRHCHRLCKCCRNSLWIRKNETNERYRALNGSYTGHHRQTVAIPRKRQEWMEDSTPNIHSIKWLKSVWKSYIYGHKVDNQWIITSQSTNDFIFTASSLIGNSIKNNRWTLTIDFMKYSASIDHIEWLSSFVGKNKFRDTTEKELITIFEALLKEGRMHFSVLEQLINVFFDKCQLFGIGTDSEDIAALNHFFNTKWEITLSMSVIAVNGNIVEVLY